MRKFLISITLLSLVIYSSWYYHYGYLVGKDAREVTDILIDRGLLVIHPRNENEIYDSCATVERVSFVNSAFLSVIIFHVNDQCVVESISLKWVE